MKKRLSYLFGIALLGISFTQAVAQKQQVILGAQKSEGLLIEQTDMKTSKSISDTIHYDGINDNAIGTGTANSYGAYIYLPTDTTSNYVGKNIKQVMLYISGASDVTSAELEIHHDQSSGAVYTQSFVAEEGWNNVILTTPYELSATQDLYLGYFLNVTGGYTLGCDAGPTAANGNGDWILFSGSWTHLPALNAALTYNWNIRALVGEVLSNDAALTELDVDNYQLEGEVTIDGTIANYGSTELTSIDVNWQIDDGTVYTETISDLTLALNDTYTFSHADTWTATIGDYNLKVWLSNMNGTGGDEFTINDTIERTIHVVTFIPQKKVFGEEATGTWCGWCVRGHVFMDSMAYKYPDTWIGVAVHNGDPMVNTVYDNGIGNLISGYPSGLVDRVPGTFDPSAFEAAYLQQINEVPPASIDVTFTGWDSVTRVVTFDVSSEFVVDYTNVRFNAVISENYVTGTTSGYAQANYYSGGGNGPMAGYETMPNPVPAADMVYMHVAREIIGGWDGTVNSIPASVSAGETHSYSYEYTVPEDFNLLEMDLIGLLIDQTSGKVLNANDLSVTNQAITFNVTDGTDPIEGARVFVTGSGEHFTDVNGTVVLSELFPGDYEYEVTATDYNTISGTVTVNDEDVTEDIVMSHVGINASNMIDFNVYPNPVKDILSVEIPGKFDVKVLNSVGQVVSSKVIDGNGTIKLNNLSSGVYFVKISNESQIGVKQIIVE